jgi:hypothetical protein
VKKRSKLDLNPDVAQDKSQAAGFGADIPEESEPQPEQTQAGDGCRQARRGRQARTSVSEQAVRSSRTLIMMSVAVIAVAAVSLFVLKRR